MMESFETDIHPQRYEDLPDVLYVCEVAAYLRQTERFVRYHIERGHIHHERIGNRIVVPRRALQNLTLPPAERGAS